MKYLGVNLPKETKDLYSENYKTLMEDIKEDTKRWKDIPCSWIGRVGVPVVAQWLTNPTRSPEVAGWIPGLAQWVKEPVLR